MQDTDFYEQILGLRAPWRVEQVELDVSEGQVRVHRCHPEGICWKCPECERELSCYDHAEG